MAERGWKDLDILPKKDGADQGIPGWIIKDYLPGRGLNCN